MNFDCDAELLVVCGVIDITSPIEADGALVSEIKMQNNVSLASPDLVQPSYFARVFQNDATKKGVAAAAAGLLVAVVQEAIWPSK